MAGTPQPPRSPGKKIGPGTCSECGANVTYEVLSGAVEPVALDIASEIATRQNHRSLYRMRTVGERVFEPVTRPGQSGQMVHRETCPATAR